MKHRGDHKPVRELPHVIMDCRVKPGNDHKIG
jgi:hypothetical protein